MKRPQEFYYTIDLTGDSLFPILDKSWNIESVRIYSIMFNNDLDTLEEMQVSMEEIMSSMSIEENDWPSVSEKIDYNPDFFPSLRSDEDKEEILKHKEEAEFKEDEMSEALEEQGKMALMVTTIFDEDGDNICSRWNLSSPKFEIVGKVVLSVDHYLESKAMKKMEFKESFLCFKQTEYPEDIIYN